METIMGKRGGSIARNAIAATECKSTTSNATRWTADEARPPKCRRRPIGQHFVRSSRFARSGNHLAGAERFACKAVPASRAFPRSS